MKKEAANTFTDGLITDLNPISTPNSALIDCLNGTFLTYDGNEMILQNDKGNYKLKGSELSKDFMPIAVASYGDILYIISYNALTDETELGSFPSPNTTVSSELNNEMQISSILDQAFEDFEKNRIAEEDWTYDKLIEKYQKSYVFYGLNDDLKISPGDFYKISGLPVQSEYERLEWYSFLNDKSIKIDVTTSETEESVFNPVSWQAPGYLECKYSLPVKPTISITEVGLDVPTKSILKKDGEDEIIYTGEFNIKVNIILSSTDELIEKAINEGKLKLEGELYYQSKKLSSFDPTTNFNINKYGINNSYTYTHVFNLKKELYEQYNPEFLDLHVNCYLTVENPRNPENIHNILYISQNETLSVSSSQLVELENNIGNTLFRYKYNSENHRLFVDVNADLAFIPSTTATNIITLNCYNYNGNKESITIYNNSGQPITDLYKTNDNGILHFQVTLNKEDFYVFEFLFNINDVTNVAFYKFVVCDSAMNYFYGDGEDPLYLTTYPKFDDISGDDWIQKIIPFKANGNLNISTLNPIISSYKITCENNELVSYVKTLKDVKDLFWDNLEFNPKSQIKYLETLPCSLSGNLSGTLSVPENGIFGNCVLSDDTIDLDIKNEIVNCEATSLLTLHNNQKESGFILDSNTIEAPSIVITVGWDQNWSLADRKKCHSYEFTIGENSKRLKIAESDETVDLSNFFLDDRGNLISTYAIVTVNEEIKNSKNARIETWDGILFDNFLKTNYKGFNTKYGTAIELSSGFINVGTLVSRIIDAQIAQEVNTKVNVGTYLVKYDNGNYYWFRIDPIVLCKIGTTKKSGEYRYTYEIDYDSNKKVSKQLLEENLKFLNYIRTTTKYHLPIDYEHYFGDRIFEGIKLNNIFELNDKIKYNNKFLFINDKINPEIYTQFQQLLKTTNSIKNLNITSKINAILKISDNKNPFSNISQLKINFEKNMKLLEDLKNKTWYSDIKNYCEVGLNLPQVNSNNTLYKTILEYLNIKNSLNFNGNIKSKGLWNRSEKNSCEVTWGQTCCSAQDSIFNKHYVEILAYLVEPYHTNWELRALYDDNASGSTLQKKEFWMTNWPAGTTFQIKGLSYTVDSGYRNVSYSENHLNNRAKKGGYKSNPGTIMYSDYKYIYRSGDPNKTRITVADLNNINKNDITNISCGTETLFYEKYNDLVKNRDNLKVIGIIVQ